MTSLVELDRVDGLGFPEALRWRDGWLWFSDMFRSRVLRWRPGEPAQVVLDRDTGGPEVPGGLGWLPDGRLLVVDCLSRALLRVEPDGEVVVHADLSAVLTHPANDAHVDADGVAWVGGYGFGPGADAPAPSSLVRVAPDGSITVTDAPLVFPNGCERRADGALVVAETFADRVAVLEPDASAVRSLLPLPEGSGPDGLSLDFQGTPVVALAFAGSVVRLGDELDELYRAGAIADGPGAGALGCYDCAIGPDGVLAVAVASADEALAERVDTGSIVLLGRR